MAQDPRVLPADELTARYLRPLLDQWVATWDPARDCGKMFSHLNKSGSGHISRRELEDAVQGYPAYKDLPLALLTLGDADHDGHLSAAEFERLCLRARRPRSPPAAPPGEPRAGGRASRGGSVSPRARGGRAIPTDEALAGASREVERLESRCSDNRGAIDQEGERRACADPTRFTLSLAATQTILASLGKIKSEVDCLDLQTTGQRYARRSIRTRIERAEGNLQPHLERLLAPRQPLAKSVIDAAKAACASVMRNPGQKPTNPIERLNQGEALLGQMLDRLREEGVPLGHPDICKVMEGACEWLQCSYIDVGEPKEKRRALVKKCDELTTPSR